MTKAKLFFTPTNAELITACENPPLVIIVDETFLREAALPAADGIIFITWQGSPQDYNWNALSGAEIIIATTNPQAFNWFELLNAPIGLEQLQPIYISTLADILDNKEPYILPIPVAVVNHPIKAHGLVGEIAAWITATAIRPQPILSLAAALTFVGALKGHKYATSTDLRTNLLTLSLAKTTAGKEHPQNCIHRLIKAADLKKLALAEPTSGTGLLTGLNNAGRVGLLILDEAGRYIANATNPRAGGYQKEIIDYIIKSFSKANGVLIGKQYANEKLNPRIDIIAPHLCFLGSTVKEKLLQACTSTDAIDGFLNRWLVFESQERPEKNPQGRPAEPPKELIAAVKIIAAKFGMHGDPYGLADEPMIRVINYTPEALKIMDGYITVTEQSLSELRYPLDALYGRSAEHVAKVSLTLCDNEFIREQDVLLAIDIVEESCKLIANFAGLVADNQHEADYIRVREIIKRERAISRNDLTRKTQFLPNQRRRAEILSDMIETGIISLEEKNRLHVYKYVV